MRSTNKIAIGVIGLAMTFTPLAFAQTSETSSHDRQHTTASGPAASAMPSASQSNAKNKKPMNQMQGHDHDNMMDDQHQKMMQKHMDDHQNMMKDHMNDHQKMQNQK